MWPVQTLTLLLCLTDDEQLFAQHMQVEQEPARLEQMILPTEEPEEDEHCVAYPEA